MMNETAPRRKTSGVFVRLDVRRKIKAGVAIATFDAVLHFRHSCKVATNLASMASEPENLTLRLLQDMRQEMRREFRDVRADVGQVRDLVLLLSESLRRTDRHIAELPTELETMLKTEFLGRMANFETRMERRVDDEIERRLQDRTAETATPTI